jgi:hypothetical protein
MSKPNFYFETEGVRVNFYTCKWHLTKPNLSLCWIFNVIVLIEELFIKEFESRRDQIENYWFPLKSITSTG